MAYFVDTSESLSIQEVTRQPFKESSNKLSLGTAAKSTWARIELQNTGTTEQPVYLHHPYAYHNQLVGFYLYRNDELLDQQIIDMDEGSQHPLMYQGSAVFPFVLTPGLPYSLYVHSRSYSHQWFTLQLLDAKHSRRALIGSHNDIALLTGVLVALIFYNFLLYFASSRKENIYYSMYLASGAIWIALSYGLFANAFDLYGSGIFRAAHYPDNHAGFSYPLYDGDFSKPGKITRLNTAFCNLCWPCWCWISAMPCSIFRRR